jgi:acyl-CoA thioesterase YciA
MPADTNANGDIFGGWLMAQMDMGGAILAKEIAHGRVVTVRVDGMTFLRPVAVGDVVCCYARCVKRGNSSISINIEVWVKKVSSEPIGQRYKATEALFIYVAVDSQGNPASYLQFNASQKKPPIRRLFLFHFRPAVQAEHNIHNQPAARFTRFVTPLTHGGFHFTFEHV